MPNEVSICTTAGPRVWATKAAGSSTSGGTRGTVPLLRFGGGTVVVTVVEVVTEVVADSTVGWATSASVPIRAAAKPAAATRPPARNATRARQPHRPRAGGDASAGVGGLGGSTGGR